MKEIKTGSKRIAKAKEIDAAKKSSAMLKMVRKYIIRKWSAEGLDYDKFLDMMEEKGFSGNAMSGYTREHFAKAMKNSA